MKIETFKKLKDNKYLIKLDNLEEVILYDDVIVKYTLLVNKELDKNKLKEIVNYNSRMDAYYLSIKSLNKKMRTRKEIFKMLKKQEFDDTLINEIIDKLYQDNYLNDERYITAYVNDQINLNLIGPNKIRNNLVDLGFEISDISNYLDNIADEVWIRKIDKYISKKLKSTSNLSASKLRQKIAVDLVTKGFSKDMVMNIIDTYEFKTDESVLLKEYNKIRNKLESKYSDKELSFQIKNKLYAKGFTLEEIENILKGD